MRAVLVALAICTATPALADDKPAWRYKGKSLADWVEALRKAPTDLEQAHVSNVIAGFGAEAAPAVPELVGLLDDRDAEFRQLVAGLLYRLGSNAKAAVPELTKQLAEKKARDPRHVIDILGGIGPDAKDAVPALTAVLKDRELRGFAFRALCEIGRQAQPALPDLKRIALEIATDEEAGKDVRLPYPVMSQESGSSFNDHPLSYLRALGPDAVPILLALLEAPGKKGREAALREFEELGPDGAKGVPALRKLLKTNEPNVRYLACAALWKIEKSPDVVPVLIELLRAAPDDGANKDYSLTMKAVHLLEDIGPAAKDALPALKALLLLPKPAPPRVYLPSFALSPREILHEIAQGAIDKIEGKSTP